MNPADSTTFVSENWHSLGPVAQLFGTRVCRSMEVEGRKIGLFNVDGTIFAIDDICSHGNARLSEGDLDGFKIECPLHAGLFDVRSGKALTAPVTRDVRSHTVRIDGNILLLRLEA